MKEKIEIGFPWQHTHTPSFYSTAATCPLQHRRSESTNAFCASVTSMQSTHGFRGTNEREREKERERETETGGGEKVQFMIAASNSSWQSNFVSFCLSFPPIPSDFFLSLDCNSGIKKKITHTHETSGGKRLPTAKQVCRVHI